MIARLFSVLALVFALLAFGSIASADAPSMTPRVFLPYAETGVAGAWSLSGNAGTMPGMNFLGTIDAQPLVVKTNNTERMRIDASGNVGVGTITPTFKLHLAGNTLSNWPIIKLENVDPGGHAYWLYAGANGVKTDFGIYDQTAAAYRFYIQGSTGNVGIGTTSPTEKLHVESASGGVYGVSHCCVGVAGESNDNAGAIGVFGQSDKGYGVWGQSANGSAAYFSGKVHVSGTLEKAGGSFKIDHPLDPANEYLFHSFVESPDMKNVYDGVVTTDDHGDATVVLPDWFETLNRDFRYQLTIVGKQWAQARVEEEIQNNRFSIKTDKPNVKVSWQVTGIRHDPWAEQHRIPVEEQKPETERGKYLYPKEYGQPETLGIDYQKLQQVKMSPSIR